MSSLDEEAGPVPKNVPSLAEGGLWEAGAGGAPSAGPWRVGYGEVWSRRGWPCQGD